MGFVCVAATSSRQGYLGIGCERGNYCGVTREWMYWYDEAGKRYPTPQEQITTAQQQVEFAEQRVKLAEQRAQQEAQRAQQLAEKLRELGVDPDNLG